MKHLLFGILLLASWAAGAQKTDFTGSWKGYLTQNQGGYRSRYAFEPYLIQKGEKITGRSYVSVDNIYAELDIEGEVLEGKRVIFREIRFIRFTEMQNLEWCFKVGQLELIREGHSWKLEGPWEGFTNSGRCIPGRVYLSLEKPRA